MTKKLYNRLVLLFLILPIFTCKAQPFVPEVEIQKTQTPLSEVALIATPVNPAVLQPTRQSTKYLQAVVQEQPNVLIPEVTDLPVLADGLQTGWQDWSWDAVVDFNSEAQVYTGTKSALVTFSAAWAGAQFGYHGEMLDISSYDMIVFWVNGGNSGGQVIRFALSSTASTTEIVQDFTLTANTWTKIEIPISSLGKPRKAYKLVWQNFSDIVQAPFYLDEVAFVDSGSLPPTPTEGPSLSIDTALDRHTINEDIYGMNFMGAGQGEEAFMDEIRLPVNRWGGNSTTRYNWTNNASNHAMDWYFENLPQDLSADQFISRNQNHAVKTLLTIPMIGYVAKDDSSCGFAINKYGPQQDLDIWRVNCGNGKSQDGKFLTGNDPLDTGLPITTTFVTNWIQHLILTFGSAENGGVRYYNLDNEPMLWNSTHRDVRPEPLSYDELRNRTFAYAAAIKASDPGAITFGPAEWGWSGYFYSALDMASGSDWWNLPVDRLDHNNTPLVEWYLQQMSAYESSHGIRLLDYLDEHFYPQANGVSLQSAGSAATQALRLRSTRSLWDSSYIDESWIGQSVYMIPRMRQWVTNNYPGTRLAIGEYNWGGLEHINGALSQADVLGIFGREGLDLATLWAPPTPDQPGAFAFRMFRNFDGKGGSFGNISVQALSTDQEKLSTYAALSSSNDSLSVVVINKAFVPLTSTLTVANFGNFGGAWVYRYSDADLTGIQALGFQNSTVNTLQLLYPANSITVLMIQPQLSSQAKKVFLPILNR